MRLLEFLGLLAGLLGIIVTFLPEQFAISTTLPLSSIFIVDMITFIVLALYAYEKAVSGKVIFSHVGHPMGIFFSYILAYPFAAAWVKIIVESLPMSPQLEAPLFISFATPASLVVWWLTYRALHSVGLLVTPSDLETMTAEELQALKA